MHHRLLPSHTHRFGNKETRTTQAVYIFCMVTLVSMVSMVMPRVMQGMCSRVNGASICSFFTGYRTQV